MSTALTSCKVKDFTTEFTEFTEKSEKTARFA
jgi:hypothetical protein